MSDYWPAIYPRVPAFNVTEILTKNPAVWRRFFKDVEDVACYGDLEGLRMVSCVYQRVPAGYGELTPMLCLFALFFIIVGFFLGMKVQQCQAAKSDSAEGAIREQELTELIVEGTSEARQTSHQATHEQEGGQTPIPDSKTPGTQANSVMNIQ